MVYKTSFEFVEEIDFEIIPYRLVFNKPARTSRDVLNERAIFFVKVFFKESSNVFGIGECAPIYGLNPEKEDEVVKLLQSALSEIKKSRKCDPKLISLPAIRFAIETAMLDLMQGGQRFLFGEVAPTSQFPINGLVWMNTYETMLEEAIQKVESGFEVIKLKIGGIDFQMELMILQKLRELYSDRISIRLDANGAFSVEEAMTKLERLSEYRIHSIEQPIRAGQWDEMARLCRTSPIPIALDEELIGIDSVEQKKELIQQILPQYIILKPTLHGGFVGCDEWIDIAGSNQVKWWATSALESNIGLNAIAQWLAVKSPKIEQGLGTGSLYLNNLNPAWVVEKGFLKFENINALNQDIYNLK
jgi:o-succinylbenzoate synthase